MTWSCTTGDTTSFPPYKYAWKENEEEFETDDEDWDPS
jgi:hypothetical protein